MTYLEKYKQHYGELAMEERSRYGFKCPKDFAAIRNADKNAPSIYDGKCMGISCIDCWNREMEEV